MQEQGVNEKSLPKYGFLNAILNQKQFFFYSGVTITIE